MYTERFYMYNAVCDARKNEGDGIETRPAVVPKYCAAESKSRYIFSPARALTDVIYDPLPKCRVQSLTFFWPLARISSAGEKRVARSLEALTPIFYS